MKNYSKKCWSCGSKEVLPIKDYFECSKCGATWVPMSGGGSSPISEDSRRDTSDNDRSDEKRYRPSGSAVRQAQKQREKSTTDALPD